MGEILLLNKFFPIVDTCLSCEDIARESCAMVPMAIFASFLRTVFSASHVQHISYLHSKFALSIMCGSMGDIQFPTAENRREKKEEIKKKESNYSCKIGL